MLFAHPAFETVARGANVPFLSRYSRSSSAHCSADTGGWPPLVLLICGLIVWFRPDGRSSAWVCPFLCPHPMVLGGKWCNSAGARDLDLVLALLFCCTPSQTMVIVVLQLRTRRSHVRVMQGAPTKSIRLSDIDSLRP